MSSLSSHNRPMQPDHDSSAVNRSLADDAEIAHHNTQNRPFRLSHSNLPPLPPDSAFEDSMLSPRQEKLPDSSELEIDHTGLFESHVKKNLMSIESSFLPEASPNANPSAAAPGADDTYLFGGSPGRTTNLTKTPAIAEESSESDIKSTVHHQPNPTTSYTPLQSEGGAEETGTEDTSEFTQTLSSPAAAAQQRNMSRGYMKPSQGRQSVEGDGLREDTQNSLDRRGNSTDNGVHDDFLSSSRSPGSSLRPSKRPSFLQNRHASQRSSVSSAAAQSDISESTDVTVGADFALQSGGAVSSRSVNGHSSLSRLPSLGSIASFTSSQSDTAPHFNRTRSSTSATGMAIDSALSKLDEEEPITPRAVSMMAPSDTIIAQHVQNIHVPETIAREYRARHSNTTRSPERRQMIGLSYSTRSKHNLTLKEQNSKIDKLSKENFDLKLKIHFLDQALQNRSDEGVKEMINKNVQLQTDLANEKKDNMSLRRKIRELEKRVKVQEEQPKDKSDDTEDESASDDDDKAELEEEITYLRETMQRMQFESDKLKEENLSKEVEKRRLAEYVKSMGDIRTSEPSSAVEETIEMWKDLLQAETARREAADDDAAKLREEIRLFKEQANSTTHASIRNVYNLSKRQSTIYGAPSESGASELPNDMNGGGVDSRASTLVDQLKHENAELRRDLSAQTSMLTSRNRERERLQLEIEDLKIQHRRGGMMDVRSVAGDSIFDRSVSRAHQRSVSRASGVTRAETHISEEHAEQLEKKMGTLRDELAQVKMLNQDLERELNEHLDAIETLENENIQLRDEGNMAVDDLRLLQTERDELLNSIQEKDADFETLRSEAVESIQELEAEVEGHKKDFETLQAELKTMSESAVNLDDELNTSRRKEEALEQQLEEMEREMENLDQKLQDMTSKNERLEVQMENSQNEIAFLREEQESDKIKIGELEAELAGAQANIEDMLAQTQEERLQRETIDSKEKADVQKMFDDLNSERSKLRRKLADKEKEADTWRERLETLESNLREALGDLNGTRSSLLKDVTKLQRDLEHTLSALEIARQDLSERERLLRTRDTLLESSGLESKRLSEALEKERQARRADRSAWDIMQRNQQSLTHTIQQNDSRVAEVEKARQSDRRRYAQIEHTLKDQLAERNSLLTSIWNRLTGICGADFIQRNGLGDVSPSGDNLVKNWSQFSRSVGLATKTIESMLASYRTQIRDLDKSLSKEFQNLERALEIRSKRIDHLETTIRSTTSRLTIVPDSHENGARSNSGGSTRSAREEQYARLKSENKILKAEISLIRNVSSGSPSHGVPERGSSHRDRDRSRRDSASLLRHYSASMVEGVQNPSPIRMHSPVAVDPTVTVPAAHPPPTASHIPIQPDSPSARRSSHQLTSNTRPSTSAAPLAGSGLAQPTNSEQRWVHRLKELERRLKAEREARLIDRSGARKRIEESEAEKETLRRRLEREIEKRHSLEEDRLLEGQSGDEDNMIGEEALM